MRQMKKKIIIAIIVTLLLTAAVAVTIGFSIVKKKNEEINLLQEKIVDTECWAFASDLKADSIITQNDLKPIKMKLTNLAAGSYKAVGNNAVHMILDEETGSLIESQAKADLNLTMESFVGRVVKSNVSANTLVMDSLLYVKDEEPTKDERIQEFNFIQIPSDVVENDYVDIRIQFPTGEDYSVLIGKKVEKIAGANTIFIKLNEEEIMAMGSAIIEAYMQKGVRLYANKYTEPATQLFNEAIVDYVAKYEKAVEKLMDEKVNMNLRKLAVAAFEKDGLYTKVDPTTSGLDSSVVGIIKYTALKGETLIEKDEEIVLEENREVTLNVIKNKEKQLMIAEGSWTLVTKEYKANLLAQNSDADDIEIEDLENEILALYAGIREEYIEEIKLASLEEKNEVLSYYKVMRVQTRDEIIRTYPVRKEVLAVVKNNPNLLEVIKAEFNTTALLNTKIDEYDELKAKYDAAFDEYTKKEIENKMKELVGERLDSVEENLKTEIEAQKAERVSYLESLING